jgi:cell division protein FtsL
MRVDQQRAGKPPAVWTGAFGLGSQHAARFHRETDRTLRRTMLVAAMGAALAVGGVLGVVALRVHQVRLSYQIDGLRSTRAALEERTRLLRVEMATLRSLARIEGRARTELGMVAPAANQVLLAREFVAGGGNAVGAAPPRTAAAERARAGDARVR